MAGVAPTNGLLLSQAELVGSHVTVIHTRDVRVRDGSSITATIGGIEFIDVFGTIWIGDDGAASR